jgi:hypothetical protein
VAAEDIRRPPAHFCSKQLLSFVSSSAMLIFGMGLGLRIRILLIVIDRTADVVLPLIDLLMFLRGQLAAVRRDHWQPDD